MTRTIHATFTDGIETRTYWAEMDVDNNTTLHQFYHYLQRNSFPHRDDSQLSRVTIFLIPDTPGRDVRSLVNMALGSQARYGKRIGLPWLKHFHNSLPTDLLTNWIPNLFPEFDLLIFRGQCYSQTT
jgi:hypothetical protein